MAEKIKGLLKKLKSKEMAERYGAVDALERAVREGQDISAASGALEDVISDEDKGVRSRAAWALAASYLQKGDTAGVGRLIGKEDFGIRLGAVQALVYFVRKGTDIGPLMPALEKMLGEATDTLLKGSLVHTLTNHYIRGGAQEKSARLLKHKDEDIRLHAAFAYSDAASEGIDISPSIPALREALADSNDSIKGAAADALGDFHAHRKQWKEIDRLLASKDSKIRHSIVWRLYSHITRFHIQSDIPNLIKAFEDEDVQVRSGAFSLLREAAEKGLDISFAVPVMRIAAGSGPSEVRETAAHALKAYELRKDRGKRCQYCLDCELGNRPGDESKSLEYLAVIVKEIPCCGGDVTHRIIRCKRCGKYYLSSYYDHTGFEAEEYSIKLVSKRDAEKAVKEIKKCKNPEDEDCDCDIHRKFLRHEDVPVKGVVKYSETID